MSAGDAVAGRPRGGAEALGRRLHFEVLHLFILSSFALAYPLLNLFTQFPTFLVAHKIGPVDILTFALVLVAGPPLLPAALVVAAAVFLPRLRALLHAALVCLLVTLIAMPVMNKVAPLAGWPGMALALLSGVVLAAAYSRFPRVRTFTTYMAPMLLLAPGLFLLDGSIRPLITDAAAVPAAALRRELEGVSIANPVPIVLVIFDELPVSSLLNEEHRIDSGRFPNFAALAQTGNWYRNATTVSDSTWTSIPAILTGNLPLPRGSGGVKRQAATYRSYRRNLFTLLSGAYRIKSFESITQLCPPGVCQHVVPPAPFSIRMRRLFLDGFAVYLNIILPPEQFPSVPGVQGVWVDFWESDQEEILVTPGPAGAADGKQVRVLPKRYGDNRVYAIQQMVDAIDTGEKPGFFYLHSQLPHPPWVLSPTGRRNARRALRTEGEWQTVDRWGTNPFLVNQALQRHLLQVGYVDALLGELVGKMKAVGIFDEALMVVISDHGASFQPGAARRKATRNNIHEIMPIPMIVKLPGQKTGRVFDTRVETIDIVPAVFQVIGLRQPGRLDGTSLLAGPPRERTSRVVFLNTTLVKAEDPVKIEVADAELERKDETVRKIAALFGSGSWAGVYRFGTHPGLVGRPVGSLHPGPEVARMEVRLDHGEGFTVDAASNFRPELVTGEMLEIESVTAPLHLGVAVNGVIRATVESYRSRHGHRFAALVPEGAFRAGANAVAIYLIEQDGGGGVALRPIRRSGD